MARAVAPVSVRAHAAVLVVLVAAAAASAADAAPGANGEIAATVSRGGDADIVVMRPDGRGVRTPLGTGPRRDMHAAWSPDGTRIAFATAPAGARRSAFEIAVARADGSGLTVLTDNGRMDDWPSWSPNGRRIAFERRRGNRSALFVMRRDGTGQRLLRRNRAGRLTQPAWSPGGRRIAAVTTANPAGRRVGRGDVLVLTRTGDLARRLTRSTRDERFPTWSAAGARVAFSVRGRVVVAGGHRSGRIVGRGTAPAWSPDGSRIAVDGVRLMRPDGSDPVRLGAGAVRPAWRPRPCTVVGTERADRLSGTRRDDVVCGLGGNDAIRSSRGADIVAGGPGRDTISFAAAPAAVRVGLVRGAARGGRSALLSGVEGVTGTRRADTLVGDSGPNRLEGGGGRDDIRAGDGMDDVRGGDGRDRIAGQDGDDEIRGGAGADLIAANDGYDGVRPGPGDDVARGGDEEDYLIDWHGADHLVGGREHDYLNTLGDHRGDDVVDGGPGQEGCPSSPGDVRIRCEDGPPPDADDVAGDDDGPPPAVARAIGVVA